MCRIRKWQRIERLVEHMPPNAKEIPYSDIENLKIWELSDLRRRNETYQGMAYMQ